MPEPAIIDTTTIQVKSTTKDTYGNLIVTPMVGEDIKISEKRKSLFDIFQEGATVKLFWAEYMHKKYVARAEVTEPTQTETGVKPLTQQVSQESTGKVVIAPQEKPPKTEMSKDDWAEKDKVTRKSIERQVALKAAVEFAAIKGSDDTAKVIATAKIFASFIAGEEIKSKLVEEVKRIAEGKEV